MTFEKKIQMVDLQSQYLRMSKDINQAIQNCILSSQFIQGEEVRKFEQVLGEFIQSKYTISCGNGTDALMLAFMALDLPKGSKVIVPAFTYIASVEILKLLGLEPVYCDVHPEYFMPTVEDLETAYTPDCKAVIIVHLYGQCAEMSSISAWTKEKKLYVIEDNAQSIGAQCKVDNNWEYAGTIGHIGTTSFFPSKNLGAFGDGGAIFTQDEHLAKKLKMMANHGQSQKYIHDEIGINSRLDTLQASILNVKLQHLTDSTERRKKAANLYDDLLKNLSGLQTPKRLETSTHVFHQYTIKLESETLRDSLQEYLKSKQIPSMIYYPLPVYHQKPYYQELYLPHSESLCKQVLSIPMHTEMTEEEIHYICKNIQDYLHARA